MSMPGTPEELAPYYRYPNYLFRKKMLKLFGGRIDIYGPDEQPVMVCLQKAFKLKEDIRLYADDTKTKELLTIQARSILDFSAAYDVTDALTGKVVGTLRRKGLESMIRDAWEVLNPAGQLIAKIEEDQMVLAVLRRLIEGADLIPQSFHFMAPNGQELARAKQRFNPFIHRMDLFMPGPQQAAYLDPRLVIAATTLLVLIEGRQG
ncbi:MAG: LURP-one-related/scramblase family protein [Armatimonadota bacterium]